MAQATPNLSASINSPANSSEPKKGKPIILIVAIIGLLGLVFLGGVVIFKSVFSGASKSEIIKQGVEYAKAQYKLPSKLDAYTTIVDITSEADAIRYHYIISGIDTSKLSNEALKASTAKSVCQITATKDLLDKDINLEYSYTVEGSTETFFFVVSKADCN